MDAQSLRQLERVIREWPADAPFGHRADVLDRKGRVVATVREWYCNLLYVETGTGRAIVRGGE